MKILRTATIMVFSLVGLLFLREECYANTGQVEQEETFAINWIEEIEKGGATGYALLVLAVIGIFFVIERCVNLRRKNLVGSENVVKKLRQIPDLSKENVSQFYHSNPSSFTKVVNHMIAIYDNNIDNAVSGAAEMAGREIEKQQRKNYILGIVATLAPLLGLLGTMIGMIEAFAKFAKLEDSSEAALVLGDSIGKALNTTAAGLIIAIVALFFYHFFKLRLEALSHVLEEELDSVQRYCFRAK